MIKHRIVFLDFSTRLNSLSDLETRARGGMVSSLILLTNELSKLGHEVIVLSDIKNDEWTSEGVLWCAKDGSCWLKGERFDFFVMNRGTSEGYSGINARHRILWTHDLPHAGFIPEPKNARVLSGTVFMSRYAEKVWRTFYPDIGKSFLIPNGVDKNIFYPRDKDLNYLIYGSAPNRGLNRLGYIYDCIKSAIGNHVYMNAFSNMKIMHPNEAELSDNDLAASWKREPGNGLELKDPLPQKEFAHELGTAGLMILPSDYPEICSNSVLQALASGTPVITTGQLGATPEWVRHGKNGMLTKFYPFDYMVHTLEMVRNAVNVLKNKKRHYKMINNAVNSTRLLNWSQISRMWNKMFKRIDRGF